MLEKCFIYFDGSKASIVLDITKFKTTIVHGNTNQKMTLKQVDLIDGIHHLRYQNNAAIV